MGRYMDRRQMIGLMAGVVVVALVDLDPQTVGAATLPGGPIPTESLQRFADRYGGDFAAKWIDSTGASGGGTWSLVVDPKGQRVRGSLALDGKFLGRTGLAKRSASVDLRTHGYDEQRGSAARTAWGDVTYERLGLGSVKVTLTGVPGLPATSTLEALGKFATPGFATVTYTITPRSGTPVRGAVNFGRKGTTFAMPVVPAGVVASATAILEGDYACSFFPRADATKAFGEPAKPAEPNGGRIGTLPGIDTSNCRIETVSKRQLLQTTVYHAASAAVAATFFEQNTSVSTPVPGLQGRAAVDRSGTALVLAGTDVVQLSVIDFQSSEVPPALEAFTRLIAARG